MLLNKLWLEVQLLFTLFLITWIIRLLENMDMFDIFKESVK
jgi:hypothetical protein